MLGNKYSLNIGRFPDVRTAGRTSHLHFWQWKMLCLRYYALLAPRPSYEIKTPNDALNNIGQRETPFIKRKGEHLPFRPVFDYFTAWKLHRRKGLQINVGKISLVFVVVLCSAYTRHLCPCCVWTNEESLAAAFRNSRKNRQKNVKTRVNLVPRVFCFQYGFWTFGSTFQIFLHMLIFSHVNYSNERMRDKHEIRAEVGVKENCFVQCFEFASEVIIAVPVYRYF